MENFEIFILAVFSGCLKQRVRVSEYEARMGSASDVCEILVVKHHGKRLLCVLLKRILMKRSLFLKFLESPLQ